MTTTKTTQTGHLSIDGAAYVLESRLDEALVPHGRRLRRGCVGGAAERISLRVAMRYAPELVKIRQAMGKEEARARPRPATLAKLEAEESDLAHRFCREALERLGVLKPAGSGAAFE